MSAQDFPVQVTTIVTPPYSLYLSDYASPESNALQVMVQLKELDRPEYRVKLRITIEGQGITLRTKPSYVPRALVLQGGIPEMLTGPDLSGYLNPNNLDFLGTTQQAFMRTGMFPEGFYTFKIEVLDYARNVVVSNAGLGNAFIILNDPPLINLPFNNDKVIATDPQNIIFSWTPRHSASPNAAFSTEYEFTLVELYPANRNPNDAIRASNSIYVTQTSSTSLNYGIIEPLLIPGRKYAFRIRAFDTNGKDLFKNNGYSEVHVFQYGDACIAPTNVKAEALDPARIKITWDTQDIFTNHGVQFRREGATDWEEQKTLTNALIIPGLQGNTTYEYAVHGICGTVHGSLSPRSTVLTPSADTAAFACGAPVPEIQLNTIPLQRPLGVFDVIKTADFDIILTEVTANADGTSYKGLGRAMIPWFKYAGVRVKFSNIQVNEDKRVYSGNVTTIYTKDSRFVLSADLSGSSINVDSIPDSGAPPAFNGIDTVLTVPVTDISLPTPESPVIVVLLEDGQTVEIPRERNEEGTFKDTRITDANGDTWTVDSAGRIQQGPNVAPPDALASRDSVNFQVNFAVVDNQFYGFDRKHYVDVPTDKISLNNQDYWIAWKSVETGRQDYVSATATGKNVFPESVGFKTQNGPVVAEPGSSAAIKRVSVMGLVNEQVESLTAYVRVQAPGQEQAEEVEVGRLNVKAYDKVLKKLIVVPVNGATAPAASTISEELNKIYAQAVVGWDVTVEAGITVGEEMITGLDTGESDILASFPEKMLSFVRTFRNDVSRFVDGDAYYIFLVNSPDATSEGFMPFKRQFGFVFTNKATNIITTIAHELGHGAFRLRHTFSPEAKLANEGSTQNLMDYTNPNGRELKKYQWDLVRSPENINGWFEDDEESAYTDNTYSQKVFQQIRCAFLNNETKISKLDKAGAFASTTDSYGEVTLIINDKPITVNRTPWVQTNKQEGSGSKIVYYTLYELNYGGLLIKAKKYNDQNKTEEKLTRLQDYLFPSDVNAVKTDINNVVNQLNHKVTLSNSDLEALRGIANCGAQYFTVDQKFKLITKICEQNSLTETYEDLILDILDNYQGDGKVYANEIIEQFEANPYLIRRLFYGLDNITFFYGNENNFNRFIQFIYTLWSQSDYSNATQYTYQPYVIGGAASPYTLAYKSSLFFPTTEYSIREISDNVSLSIVTHTPEGDRSGQLRYKPFQPVYFVTEKNKSILAPAADIPAIMVAGIIRTNDYEKAFTSITLLVDAGLTVSAFGNLAKLRYLKNIQSAVRITLAGIEFGSTALDILLNYTELCVDDELCQALREYNFYLQIGLLSGEALSAVYRSQLQAFKVKAAEKYAEKRSKIVTKYGEQSNEIKALDEHLGVLAKGGDEVASLRKLTNKASSIEIPWKSLDDRNIIWVNPNNNTLHTAKTFANETGASLYDAVLEGGYYVKLDLNDGRVLLGNTSGNYHAFGIIEDASLGTFKSSVLNVTDDVFNSKLGTFLGDHANKLKVLSGATSRSLTIAGKTVNLSSSKVNTFLGRFRPDIKNLFNELGSYKNVGLGETPGGINLLNKPDYYYDASTWWNAYNKPWLDKAISRADDIYLATIPQKADDIIKDGKLLGAYAEELNYLVQKNYKPTNLTSDQWNAIKTWLGY